MGPKRAHRWWFQHPPVDHAPRAIEPKAEPVEAYEGQRPGLVHLSVRTRILSCLRELYVNETKTPVPER